MDDNNKASYTHQNHRVCPKRVLGIDSLRLLALLSLNPFSANQIFTWNVVSSVDKWLQTVNAWVLCSWRGRKLVLLGHRSRGNDAEVQKESHPCEVPRVLLLIKSETRRPTLTEIFTCVCLFTCIVYVSNHGVWGWRRKLFFRYVPFAFSPAKLLAQLLTFDIWFKQVSDTKDELKQVRNS